MCRVCRSNATCINPDRNNNIISIPLNSTCVHYTTRPVNMYFNCPRLCDMSFALNYILISSELGCLMSIHLDGIALLRRFLFAGLLFIFFTPLADTRHRGVKRVRTENRVFAIPRKYIIIIISQHTKK